MNSKRVCYIWDESLINGCSRLPAVCDRASLVHNLIVAYGLTEQMTVVRSKTATYEDLKEFHSELYLDHLKTVKEVDEDYMPSEQDEEYGLSYDCEPISNMFELVSIIAGGTVTAARSLVLGLADVAINWCGGWHHAHRFGADGFCYVNDIVIGIEKLRKIFPNVLYIDLDVHHGNGVQDAYNLSKSVFTLSFHKYEPGFYPGSGGLDDIGCLIGKGYSCNFPLHSGYTDETFTYAFNNTFPLVCERFAPDAIVVQCGADALACDPHGGSALTLDAYTNCLGAVLDKRKPTLLLGGGGYKFSNAARLWSSLTARALNVDLDHDIPEHVFYENYSPTYCLRVDRALCKDENTLLYLQNCIQTIQGNIEKYLTKSTVNEEPMAKKAKTEETNACSAEQCK